MDPSLILKFQARVQEYLFKCGGRGRRWLKLSGRFDRSRCYCEIKHHSQSPCSGFKFYFTNPFPSLGTTQSAWAELWGTRLWPTARWKAYTSHAIPFYQAKKIVNQTADNKEELCSNETPAKAALIRVARFAASSNSLQLEIRTQIVYLTWGHWRTYSTFH